MTENVWAEPWAMPGLREDERVATESKERQFARILIFILAVAAV